MRKKGWFAIDGLQTGDRTLEEQMRGLDLALEEAQRRTVLDLGCAEGLIAAEFAKVASSVHGLDNNRTFLKVAEQQPRIRVDYCDLNSDWPGWLERQYDVVLALAILHKLRNPADGVKLCAKRAVSLIVVRTPADFDGLIEAKHGPGKCDLREEMARWGFYCDRTEEGPRNEPVLYFRRAH